MEVLLAQIALAKAVYSADKPYTYLVPPPLEERAVPGMRVLVPFGRGNRGSEGMILSLKRGQQREGLKRILTLLDDEAVLDHRGIQLALWMREYCFCTVYDSIKGMLPAGLSYALRDQLVLCQEVDLEEAHSRIGDSVQGKELLDMLLSWGGRGDMEQIRAGFGVKDPNPAVRLLIETQVAQLESQAQRAMGDPRAKVASLAMPAEEAMNRMRPREGLAPLQYRVTELLCQMGEARVQDLCHWTGASSQTIRTLEKKGILRQERRELLQESFTDATAPGEPITLNEEQQAALDRLQSLMSNQGPVAALLYGVTGSGKTLVYLALIQSVLEQGKTALLLVPEISLTPQTLRRFASYFGEEVAVLHSALSARMRYAQWRRIQKGEAKVVVGTRSAIFAPLDHLGLIILDEEQEGSYKSELNPRYHARDVAKYRCTQHGAMLLLSSATPSVETMFFARQGIYQLVELRHRYNRQRLPQVYIVDMKEELRQGNGSIVSTQLQKELLDNLQRGEQSILLLNRRGAHRMVCCGICGEAPSCPRCSVKLTHHSTNGRLMCHYCGYSQPLPPACPSCGGGLIFVGAGIQRVEEELKSLFPQVPLLRMDGDTVGADRSHKDILDQFHREKIPILLGTQMIAKGLDFENVTLVGVILADHALFMDDVRANERSFALLTQAVGRAGRGGKEGRAVIQTYIPQHDVIRCAAQQNYDQFYAGEIQLRQLGDNPPFQHLFLLRIWGQNEDRVVQVGYAMRKELHQRLPQLGLKWQVFGPAPASVLKINQSYRYHLTICVDNRRAVRQQLGEMLRMAQRNPKYRSVSISLDGSPC